LRQADNKDPSDANLAVIEAQQANREPLTPAEILCSKRIQTNESGTLDTVVAQIRQRMPGL
jgi:predicted kinase